MKNEEFVAPSAQELRMKQANVVRKYFNKMQRQAMAIGACAR